MKVQFRKNYKTKHPAYIYAYDINSNTYKFIGITHSQITDGIKNIKITNPNPSDIQDSYFRPFATEENTRNFSKYKYDWKTTRSTGQKARRIKQNFKKK